jgi:vacuolar-type H+-ATPase subunit I/STV1
MEEGRKSLQIKKSKNKQKPSSWFVKKVRKKYDDKKEVSQFGIISKGRKDKDEALKLLNQY